MRGLEAFGALLGRHRFLIGLVVALAGAVVGGAAILFNLMIRGWTWVSTSYEGYTTHTGAPYGVLGIVSWVFPFASSVIAALIYGPLVQRLAPSAHGHGIPEMMLAVRRKSERTPEHITFIRLIASPLTIGSGGSAGREGPIVRVGASIGSSLAPSLRLPPSRVMLLASCGATGGTAAIFHAPLAGAVFALEVILTSFSAEIFGYVVISSVIASLVVRALQGDEAVVRVGGDLAFTHLVDMRWVVILGLVTGLASLGFSEFLYAVGDLIDVPWKPLHLPEWSRPAVLGIVLGLGLLVFPEMYGSGYPTQEAAIAGKYSLGSLLLLVLGRALYTSYTIGIGGSGGVFAPTLFIGAAAGAAFRQLVAPLTNTPAVVFAVIEMGTVFADTARVPMTVVLIIVKMTEQCSLILSMMLAVVLVTGISRFLTRATIYTEKLRCRDDILDDPADSTLLGPRPVCEWMGQVPDSPLASTSIGRTISKMRVAHLSDLPVVDEDGRYPGLVSAINLALARQADSGLDIPLSALQLSAPSVCDNELPSVVLLRLHSANSSGLPVVDANAQTIGWVSQGDLVERMHQDQLCALAARTQSSFGPRWLERHGRSARSHHFQ